MLNALSTVLPQGAERFMAVTGGIIGGALSFAFGDIGPLLIWLTVFVGVDFATGTWAAIHTHTWSSHKNFIGILKKVLVFLVVALAHGLDEVFEPLIGICIFQSITICAYAAGEFGSIIENLERGGLGSVVPPVLRRIVATLEERIEAQADAKLSPVKGEKK